MKTMLAIRISCSVLAVLTPSAVTFAQNTTLVSVDSAGVQGNGFSMIPSISGGGRFVAFDSLASNLVPGDTNGLSDVFVHDRQTGQTTRVSVNSTGVQATRWSQQPSISGDGRFIAFASEADNFVPGDTNGVFDVFIHDRQTGQTTLVSGTSAGVPGNSLSFGSSISADGHLVAFESYASNLVSGDTNGWPDIFVHDRQTGQTKRISVDSAGVEGNNYSSRPSISIDGRFVAFSSLASNLVPGDTNGAYDIFVHDCQTGQATRVSIDSAGVQGSDHSDYPSISADGRFVAFRSYANNLVLGDTNGVLDIFVHDRQTGQTTRVSVSTAGAQGNLWSMWPSISDDGRFVAFNSDATNLVPYDTNWWADIFVHDCQTGTTTRVSVDSVGIQGNDRSLTPSISPDGSFVAFSSYATNLVPGDTNFARDVFVHDRDSGLILATSGTCPGPMTFTASNATPGATVAFIWGTRGSFTIPAGRPCAGTQLDLFPLRTPSPGYLLATADGSGTAIAAGAVPTAACGVVLMQAADLAICATSNTVSL